MSEELKQARAALVDELVLSMQDASLEEFISHDRAERMRGWLKTAFEHYEAAILRAAAASTPHPEEKK